MKQVTHVLEYEDGKLEARMGPINFDKEDISPEVVCIHEICKTHQRTSVFRISHITKKPRRHKLPSGESKYIHEMTVEEKKQLDDMLARAREIRRKKSLDRLK